MFGLPNQPKVDKPDQVLFAREIAKNLPDKDDSTKLFYGALGAYVVGKALRRDRRNK